MRLTHLAGNLGLLAGALALSLLVAEAALRLLGISHPRYVVGDEYRGYAYRPDFEWTQSREGRAQVRTNSEGFRDREWPASPSPDTVRIAVLGDSYVAALEVEVDRRFTRVLEEELDDSGAFGGRKVEVLNFGVSGYGTAQELITLRRHVWKQSPDLVILAFLTGNDVTNNSEKLQGPGRPYFVYEGGELVLDGAFQFVPVAPWKKALASPLIDHSRVLQAAYSIHRLGIRQTFDLARTRDLEDPIFHEPGLHWRIYREPQDATWRGVWRVTEGLLLLMRDEVRARSAEFLVVTLSNGIQVHPDVAFRERFERELGVGDLFYADRRIAAFCAENRIRVLSLAPMLQEYATDTGAYLHGFANATLGAGHWNETGHRLAGEWIAERVVSEFR